MQQESEYLSSCAGSDKISAQTAFKNRRPLAQSLVAGGEKESGGDAQLVVRWVRLNLFSKNVNKWYLSEVLSLHVRFGVGLLF